MENAAPTAARPIRGTFQLNDGGKLASGLRGSGMCVTTALSTALGRPYREVYFELYNRCPGRKTPKAGLTVAVYGPWLLKLGCELVTPRPVYHLPTLPPEMSSGRFLVRIAGHMCAVIDGVIHDTHESWARRTTRRRLILDYWRVPAGVAGAVVAAQPGAAQPGEAAAGEPPRWSTGPNGQRWPLNAAAAELQRQGAAAAASEAG